MKDFTLYFEKYKKIIDELSSYNEYDGNIKHLLYVIIPAFVCKYGLEREKLILKCLKETIFTVIENGNIGQEAFFDRRIIKRNNTLLVQKYIVINGLKKNEYIDLIDSVVHEFNHAVNSMINEIVITNSEIKLRTGLSYLIYSEKNSKKTDSYLLEEIINTKQSEEIISIIYNFKYNGNDEEIRNLLDTIIREKKHEKYISSAYSIFMQCCNKLLENKTFMKTVEIYRLNGDVNYIEKWFDDISGESGQLNNLISLLIKLEQLINKYEKTFFKNRIKLKILNIMNQINKISEDFSLSTVYK